MHAQIPHTQTQTPNQAKAQETKVWERVALYRIALKPEKEVEKIVEKIVGMKIFQEILQKVEKTLEPVEIWCHSRYIIEQIGSPAITVDWDPIENRLWPAFITPRDHTNCPGTNRVSTREQLIVWLIVALEALLEKLEKD